MEGMYCEELMMVMSVVSEGKLEVFWHDVG